MAMGICSICRTRLIWRASLLLPDFIVPAFSPPTSRSFSQTPKCTSRIGSTAVSVPSDVHIRLLPQKRRKAISRTEPPKLLEVEGPLGKTTLQLPPYMSLDQDEEMRKAMLKIPDRHVRKHREMWGTTRAYLQNHILGVSEGHTAILRLVGVGFRATVEDVPETRKPDYPGQQMVSLKLGYSQPIELPLPLGMKASAPQPTRVLLEGVDKEVVMQFAAKIRMWRKPEPYKGKGIFVNGETIKLKAKKIK